MPGAKQPAWTPDGWTKQFGREVPTRLRENWPRDKRVAVLLTFDTQGDIDAARPNYQTAMFSDGSINFVDQMERQYGVRCGLPRILRILRKYGIKCTFPTCGATADWYPEAVRQIHAEGHEVAVHGYWHHNMHTMTVAEQEAEIDDASLAIRKVTGVQPVGWRSPNYTGTGTTVDLLIKRGFRWMGDFANDDWPYWVERDAGRILGVPACLDDVNMYLMQTSLNIHANGNFYNTGQFVQDLFTGEFDALYAEATPEDPRLVSITFHPRVSGRPFRSIAIDGLIQHCLGHEGVWFPRVRDLVELC